MKVWLDLKAAMAGCFGYSAIARPKAHRCFRTGERGLGDTLEACAERLDFE